jgi:hypothetical protein
VRPSYSPPEPAPFFDLRGDEPAIVDA